MHQFHGTRNKNKTYWFDIGGKALIVTILLAAIVLPAASSVSA